MFPSNAWIPGSTNHWPTTRAMPLPSGRLRWALTGRRFGCHTAAEQNRRLVVPEVEALGMEEPAVAAPAPANNPVSRLSTPAALAK